MPHPAGELSHRLTDHVRRALARQRSLASQARAGAAATTRGLGRRTPATTPTRPRSKGA